MTSYSELESLLYEKKVILNVSADARNWLAKQGYVQDISQYCMYLTPHCSYDVAYGARPLKRVVQKTILNPLATKMIEGVIGDADRVTIVVKNDALDFEVEKKVAAEFLEESDSIVDKE